MSRPVIIATLLFASLGTAAAAPAPAWCKDHGFKDSPSLGQLSSSDVRDVVVTFAQAMCVPSPEVEANRASIEQNRQAWGKRLGMQEADWADVIAFDKDRSLQTAYSTKDVTKYTAVDQYMAIVEGMDRPNGRRPLRDPIYAADMFDTRLTEVGRFGYVQKCLGTVGTDKPGPVEWAICAGDLEAFDLAKFHQQLRLDTVHSGAYKMSIRFAALTINADLKKHAAEVKAAWDKDPAYKRMFDIAAAARAEWAATMAKETKLLELVASAESAHYSGSRSALAACAEATPPMLVEQVGKLPGKQFAKMFDVRFDPTVGAAAQMAPVLMSNSGVNLAATAYALCNSDGTSNLLAAGLKATPGTRGPRTLVFTRMLTEKIQLDDINERITFPQYERPYDRSAIVMSAGGVVASTVPDGKLVTVKFETMVVKREECVESHQTTRISRLHPDGRVEFEQVCDKMGIVAHDEQWGDFQLDKKYLPLLKKGVRISVAGGDLFAVWPTAKADAPTWLLGAPLTK